jgi:hypothetical protein
MKVKKYISLSTMLLTTSLFIILLLNVFIIVHPIEFISKNLWLGIPLSITFPVGLLYLDRVRYMRVNAEKIKLFQTVIHTVQDISQKSSARMQNIMLDMEEQNVSSSLKKEMNDTFDEKVKLMQLLSDLNLEELLKTSGSQIVSFKLKDEEKQ